VPATYWANTWIDRLYSAGITSGCTAIPMNFCPDDSVTRAQMAVFIEHGTHWPAAFTPPAATGTRFNDVPASYWSAAWIEQMAADGITSGCSASSFCPELLVTRAQMAVFLLRGKHGSSYSPPAATGSLFTDVPASNAYAKWIEQLANEGITSGCSATTYCPDSVVTRAQMAVFLVKTFSLP
jgi:hypothetical protein